jgi:GAF domain-containing protein
MGTRTDGIAGYEVKAGQGVAGLVLKERRSVRSEDYLTDPRFTRSPAIEAWARAEGIVSIIGAPILDPTGEIIAFLWAFNRTPRPFTARHEATMMGLAQQAALAVGQARSVEEDRRRARQTAALLDIARACTSTVELTPLPRRSRGGPCRPWAPRAADDLGARLVPVMVQLADGRADSALWERFNTLPPQPLGEVPAHAEAIRSRQPVIVARGGEWQHDAWFRAFDLTSALVVPLVSQDQVVGTMTLVHRREGRWRQDQLDLAMTIAAQIALAVDTARHYQAAQQRTAEVETLATIGETLTSTLDLQQVLEVIVDSAVTLTGGQRAVVFELDQAAGALRARAIRGIDMEPGFAPPWGRGGGSGGGAFGPRECRRARAAAPAHHTPAHRPCQWKFRRRLYFLGVLCASVISCETALGAVCVYWDEVHEPDEREIRLLSALARQAAIALDNARLVGDLRRTLDDLRAAQETLVRGATLRVSHTLEPITQSRPITVFPPSPVALA